jgi:thioredoxin-related protein
VAGLEEGRWPSQRSPENDIIPLWINDQLEKENTVAELRGAGGELLNALLRGANMSIRSTIILVALLGLAVGCSGQNSQKKGGAASGWPTSFAEANKQAKASGKIILANFTGSDWCGWCMKLKAEVFDTPEFKEWAAKNVILLELDFPTSKSQDAATKEQNRELQEKYAVEGFPSILFLKSNGDVIGKTGYMAGVPTFQ